MLKDRTHFPPGGFKFHEARTGWSSTDHIGFHDTVQEIIRHREANKGRFDWATDPVAVAAELDAYVEANLRSLYGKGAEPYLLGGAASAGPPVNPLWRSLRARAGDASAVGGATSTTKKVVSGIGTLMDWLGSGLKAVDQNTATQRALVCTTCPLNVKLEGLQKAVGTVGEFLHSVMSAKADLKLSTPHDDKLNQCSACLCHLPAKVWVPAEHIKAGMTEDVKNALAPQCWIRPLL